MWNISEHRAALCANVWKLHVFREIICFENLTVVELVKFHPLFIEFKYPKFTLAYNKFGANFVKFLDFLEAQI